MKAANAPYTLLPFRFDRLDGQVLLVNDVGQYCFLPEDTFSRLVDGTLEQNSEYFDDLLSKQMLTERGNLPAQIDMLANAYRTKKRFLFEFTTLHMVVITRRCNHNCLYCHASSLPEDSGDSLDMSSATLDSTLDKILQAPSESLKIEVQGGEPLLRFDLVKQLVLMAKEKNEALPAKKILDFVVCTNLVALTDEMLGFFAQHSIQVSTSLDGPEEIHDSCRKLRNGNGSYQRVRANIAKAIEVLPNGSVGALLTLTPTSLVHGKEIIDEYLELGLSSIFLRPLNPFGRATDGGSGLYYSTEDFVTFYKATLEYLFEVNRSRHFPEIYTSILLRRLLTPFSTGFVDLQSPAGVGISGVIYDTNGNVFVSDEARMHNYVTGQADFCIGNVNENAWLDMFAGNRLREIISNSCLEALAPCAWCAFQPFCGADPVRNLARHGTMTPYMSKTDTCKRHKAMFIHLLRLLRSSDDYIVDVLWSWLTNRTVQEIQTPFSLEAV